MEHSPAEKAFIALRQAWFNSKLRSRAHEREWETEEQELRRTMDNDAMKGEFDRQTLAILRGEDYPISPRCWNDLISARS